MPIWISSYNDGINDYDMKWTTVTRKVHCSQGSLYDISHFMKLLDADLVRATVAGIAIKGRSKFVGVK